MTEQVPLNAKENLGASLMKISSIVIALSLICSPLRALAVCDAYNHQDECERQQKADKLAKALAIRDEDVLSFPARDVDASCSFDFDTQALINACLDNAQPDYDIAKLLWDGTSLTDRKICLLMARQYGKAYQFYMSLGGCLQAKKTEADMKRPHTFNAW